MDGEEASWPACDRKSSESCELEVSPERWALGLHYCKSCADPKKKFLSMPVHKSNDVIVTDRKQLLWAGVKTPRVDGIS